MLITKNTKKVNQYFLTQKILVIKNISSLSSNKKKLIKKKLFDRNPGLSYFNNQSKFIYQPIFCDNHFDKFLDKNFIKPNNDEIIYLDNLLNKQIVDDKDDTILVLPFFKLLIENIKKPEQHLDDKDILIQSIIENSSKNKHISLAKITEEFKNVAETKNIKPIKKSSINLIMKNKLLYRFRKTSIKTDKLLKKQYIKYSFFFLKILLKSLKIGLNPIYIDECGFKTDNNNFRTWIKKDEQYYAKLSNQKTRINLIMAVTNSKILYYSLDERNINTTIFLNFMQDLISNMTEDEKNNALFILDNHKSHCTLELFQFYYNNNLKILFNVPYNSPFNMIELVFRQIKNTTYKKIYFSKNNLKKDIIEILDNEISSNTMQKLFKETLNKYKKFINDFISYNLNN